MFNAGFSEYVVPMQMTEAGLAEHLDVSGIDLGCCLVLLAALGARELVRQHEMRLDL